MTDLDSAMKLDKVHISIDSAGKYLKPGTSSPGPFTGVVNGDNPNQTDFETIQIPGMLFLLHAALNFTCKLLGLISIVIVQHELARIDFRM